MASRNTTTKIIALQRREQAFKLRLDGYRQSQIATKLGISEAQVSRILSQELAKTATNTIGLREEYRTVELARLDARELEIKRIMQHLKRSELDTYLKFHDTLTKIAVHRARLLHLEDKTILAVPVPASEQDPLAGVDVPQIVEAARQWRPPQQVVIQPEEAESEEEGERVLCDSTT
jgi:predicted transcriptional regulator